MSERDLKINERAAHAPDEIRRLADRVLEAQDCPGILAREENGYHLYIPCPKCLETHGRRELDDPKYSINLSMIAGLGDYADNTGNSWMPAKVVEREKLAKKRDAGSSICMRTRSSKDPHRFTFDRIVNMASVTERHPDILTKAVLHGGAGSAEREDMWEPDPVTGKMAPPPPGAVAPLSSLPSEHPAIEYLTSRGYNVSDLEKQFRCSFCTREYDGEQKGIFYRKMPGGWKDTPQNRVIFYSLIGGAPLTWQARVIEKVSEDGLVKLMLHPYAGGFYPGCKDRDKVVNDIRTHSYSELDPIAVLQTEDGSWGYLWSRTHTRANPQAAWQPVAPFDELRDDALRFKPSKYRTAKYSSRQMMGWDAAVARAEADPSMLKWAVLCEGPLDAARVGPGGIALIGSSISEDNAMKVVSNFHIAFSGFDNDKAGREATEKITRTLTSLKHRASILKCVPQLPLPEGKDLGDLSDAEFQALFKRAMKDMKRAF